MDNKTRNQLTDVMIVVPSLNTATSFWTNTMRLKQVDSGEGWTTLEDPETRQRITFVIEDFGSQWALAIGTTNLKITLDHLRENKVQVLKDVSSASGFEYALCRDPAGLPLLVYVR